MKFRFIVTLVLAGMVAEYSTHGSDAPSSGGKTLGDYQRDAAKFNAVISLPAFETSTNELATAVAKAIAAGNSAMDQIGRLAPAEANFTNTLRALDEAAYQ